MIKKYSKNEFDDTASIALFTIQNLTQSNIDSCGYTSNVSFLLTLVKLINFRIDTNIVNRIIALENKPGQELDFLVRKYLNTIIIRYTDALKFLVKDGHLIKKREKLINLKGGVTTQTVFYLNDSLKQIKIVNKTCKTINDFNEMVERLENVSTKKSSN